MSSTDLSMLERHVLCCHGADCKDQGAGKATDAMCDAIDALRLDNRVLVTRTRCLGLCADGPIVVVYPEGAWYGDVGAKTARRIVEQHLQHGTPLTDHVIHRMP
jgi:(2Fe-2S) ferredoxin